MTNYVINCEKTKALAIIYTANNLHLFFSVVTVVDLELPMKRVQLQIHKLFHPAKLNYMLHCGFKSRFIRAVTGLAEGSKRTLILN